MRRSRLLLLPVLLALPMVCAGCAGSVFSYEIFGPSTIAAKYVPPKEPTLVLVENDKAAAGAEADCDRLGRFISSEWKDHDVSPLVNFSALTALRDRDPDAFSRMSISAIGRATGAKQVLYVAISAYGSDHVLGGDVARWKADAKVKVVDVATGDNRWPLDMGDGVPLTVQTDPKSTDIDSDMYAARDALNQELADKISKMFYSWQPEFDNPGDYDPDK